MLKSFRTWGRLLSTLFTLYSENQVLAAQNFIVSCRLKFWTAAFLYFKVQIFLTRLAYGFPVNQCWPRK